MTLPELAIKRPIAVLMLLTSLIVLGAVAMFKLPLAFLPESEDPQLWVMVPYPNATPQQIERLIVRPLEEGLGAVRGVKGMFSNCDRDAGRIRLQFDWGADLSLAKIEVREQIDRIRSELPDDVQRILISSNWNARESDSPILEGRLSSALDLSESYDLLERRIVNPLERIPGVAQVRLDGVNPKEVRINLRLRDLEAHGIDVREVSSILRGSNFDQSLGAVNEPEMSYQLRTVGAYTSIEEISDLVLNAEGVHLRDVADVRYEEPPLEYGRHLDGQFAIGITISKESSANTVTICDEVQAKVAQMAEDPELDGVNFLIWMNQGEEIRSTIVNLFYTGILGAILATLVLYLFLRRFSSTAIAVSCIPFSLIVTCGILWVQGKSLNTISLLGLIVGIGMLVDNAVVVMENIFRYQEKGYDRATAARLGAREVSTAVVAATVTSVIVFLPLIFSKPSEMNIILRELALTVCITLLASLLISQTLIPLAAAHLLPRKFAKKTWPLGRFLEHAMGRSIHKMETTYTKIMKFNLRHRWIAPIAGLVVVGSAVYPFQQLDMNFDSSESEAFVGISYKYSEPLSLERKEEVVSYVEAQLVPHKEELGAKSIYSFWSERWGITRLYMKEGQTTEKDIARVRREAKKYLPEIPGIQLEIMDAGPMWRQDRGKRVACQIMGEDSEVLAVLAEEAKRRIGQIPGLVDPFSGVEDGGYEMVVSYDRDLVSRFGISPRQPAEVIQLTYRGQNLPSYRTKDGERNMRLTLDESAVESESQLRNLPLWTPEGQRVPLASLASFETKQSSNHIRREDRMTSVWVGAKYDEGKREDYIPAVKAALSEMDFPYGYEYSFNRFNRRRDEQSQEFFSNLIFALLLIFAVMAGLFESIRQAFVLMFSIPFALAGATWALWATHIDIDQPALIGAMLLIGIVVNNGIVMIEHINLYRHRGMRRNRALLQGGRERLRPIIMTMLTTLLGLIPIWIQKPALAGMYYYSMAVVIMAGLFVSTVFTLILLPATASLVDDIPAALRRVFGKLLRRPKAGELTPVGRDS